MKYGRNPAPQPFGLVVMTVAITVMEIVVVIVVMAVTVVVIVMMIILHCRSPLNYSLGLSG